MQPSVGELNTGQATNCLMRTYKITDNIYKLCITPRLELATLQYLYTMFDDD